MASKKRSSKSRNAKGKVIVPKEAWMDLSGTIEGPGVFYFSTGTPREVEMASL